MDVLGNSLDMIAKEKSGVIKPNVPVVLGNTCKNSKEIEDRVNLTGS